VATVASLVCRKLIVSVALISWRALIVGSRIFIFVLFASVFHNLLIVIIVFHYLLMFALVFYHLRSSMEPSIVGTETPSISRIVYNIVTPFLYIFDFFRAYWLEGFTLNGYLMCYVPMYLENVLMSGLVLWSVSTTPSPAWYIVPGCVSVILMFPMGVLVQLAYYRYLRKLEQSY